MKAVLVWFVLLLGVVATAGTAGAAHMGTAQSDCEKCHHIASSSEAPKVIPEEPGFFAKLFGSKRSFKGHEQISCNGAVAPDGTLTGCHNVEAAYRDLLVLDLANMPIDTMCIRCHPNQGEFGMHHPSYKMDKDGDGVGEKLVRPVAVQEVFSTMSPKSMPEPVATYPDALFFVTDEEGKRELVNAIPLETVVEVGPDGEQVTYDDIVTCTTCHNPHYGYLVALGEDDKAGAEQVARLEGDALLRKRDYDNTLCLACH